MGSLQSVLVEFVKLVPVGSQQLGRLPDLLALQWPGLGEHLLLATQRVLQWAP